MLLLLYAYLSIVIPFFNLFYACRTSRPSEIEERPRYLFIRTAPITFRLPNHAHFFKLTSRLKETLRNVRNLSVLSSLEIVEKTWRITVFLVFGLFFFFSLSQYPYSHKEGISLRFSPNKSQKASKLLFSNS